MCLAFGKPCSIFDPLVLTFSPPHSNWSNLHAAEEGWNGEKQKEREKREKELKEKELNKNSISPQTDPTKIFNLLNTFKDRYRNCISKTILKEEPEEEKRLLSTQSTVQAKFPIPNTCYHISVGTRHGTRDSTRGEVNGRRHKGRKWPRLRDRFRIGQCNGHLKSKNN